MSLPPKRLIKRAALLLSVVPLIAFGQSADPMRSPTRDEYRKCLADMDDIEEQRLVFHVALRKHEIVARDLKTLQAVHVSLQARINTRDHAAVDAFNRKIESLNQMSVKASAESVRLQKMQFEINESAVSVNQRCGGKVTPAIDQEAVLLERLMPRPPK